MSPKKSKIMQSYFSMLRSSEPRLETMITSIEEIFQEKPLLPKKELIAIIDSVEITYED